MTTITASDLLAKQREVKQAQDEQARAWATISRLEREVEIAKEQYDTARWTAECAAAELKSLEDAVSERMDKEIRDAI